MKKLAAVFIALVTTLLSVSVYAGSDSRNVPLRRHVIERAVISNQAEPSVPIEVQEAAEVELDFSAEYKYDQAELSKGITIDYSLTNNSEADKLSTVVYGIYTISAETNRTVLQNYKFQTVSTAPGESKTGSLDVSPELTAGSSNYTIKAYVLDSFESLEPVSNIYVLNNAQGIVTTEVIESKYTLDKGLKVYATSNNPDNFLRFEIKDNRIITLTCKNQDAEKETLDVFLTAEPDYTSAKLDLNGDGVIDQYDRPLVDKVNDEFNTDIDISRLPDGKYYLQIFYTNEENTTVITNPDGSVISTSYNSFSWYFNDDLSFRIEDSKASFEYNTVTYDNNAAVRQADTNSPQYYLTQPYPTAHENWIVHNDARITAMAQEITQGANNDYNRLLLLHDWIADNVFYDYESFANDSIPTNLIATDVLNSTYKGGRAAVCHGYSNLFASFARALGIPCRVVTGYADGNGISEELANQMKSGTGDFSAYGHAWNEAYVDGKWINIDVTWDSANEYNNVNGDEQLDGYWFIMGGFDRSFFDMPDPLFASSHFARGHNNE